MGNEAPALNGELLDGAYRIGRMVDASAAVSTFETEFGPDARPALIKIAESDSPEGELLADRWRDALALSHPNLLRMYATRATVLNGIPVVYAIIERAEESLEGVLAERTLTPDETCKMLEPTVAALEYLHQSGYRLSELTPSNVLAVGDQLKLSPEGAVRLNADESPAEDMRALGELILRALTGRMPESDEGATASQIGPPLDDIVRNCLAVDPASRWRVEQVRNHLNTWDRPSVRSEVTQPEAEEIRTDRFRELPEPSVGWREKDTSVEPRPGMRKWAYAALGVAALAGVVLAITRNPEPKPIPATTTVVKPAVVKPAPPDRVPAAPDSGAASLPERPVAPVPASTQAARPVEGPEPVQTAAPSGGRKSAGTWSVILAAYNSRDAAEKRVQSIAKRWPNFHVTLSEAKSEKVHYIVTLGQGLSQDEAEALRKRAVASGMPRDAYIKRVM